MRPKSKDTVRHPKLGRAIRRSVDISTAVLMLTGQVTVIGVFAVPSGLFVSVTGPILRGTRLLGKSELANVTIDAIDVIIALLLILGQLTVYGPFVGPGQLSITITGAPFGITSIPVAKSSSEIAQTFFGDLKQIIIRRYVFGEQPY